MKWIWMKDFVPLMVESKLLQRGIAVCIYSRNVLPETIIVIDHFNYKLFVTAADTTCNARSVHTNTEESRLVEMTANWSISANQIPSVRLHARPWIKSALPHRFARARCELAESTSALELSSKTRRVGTRWIVIKSRHQTGERNLPSN